MNNTQQPVSVWFRSETASEWYRPPLRLAPQESRKVKWRVAGRAHIVVRTGVRDDRNVGLIDLRRIAELSADPKFVIEQEYVVREVEEEYTVMVPRVQYRTRTEKSYTRVWEDDHWVLVPQTRTKEYAVTVEVPERRVRTRTLSDLEVGAVVTDAEHSWAADDFVALAELDELKSRLQGAMPDEMARLFVDGESLSMNDCAVINEFLREKALLSDVHFVTDEAGAGIEYRLLGDTNVQTTGPTNHTLEDVGIGLYRVWTVRDGRRTSKKGFHRIVREAEQVYVQEHL